MASATNPAITGTAGGAWEIAFQGANTDLWTTGAAGVKDWGQGMMAGSSPTMAPNGASYQAGFQANTTDLYLYNPSSESNTSEGMLAGTSPSIAALATGGHQL